MLETSELLQIFNNRHEERRDVWGLPDEVARGAASWITKHGARVEDEAAAVLLYDELAINAYYRTRKEAAEDGDKTPADFTTSHYIVKDWARRFSGNLYRRGALLGSGRGLMDMGNFCHAHGYSCDNTTLEWGKPSTGWGPDRTAWRVYDLHKVERVK